MAGLYVAEDPGAIDDAVKKGSLSLRFGLGGCCARSARVSRSEPSTWVPSSNGSHRNGAFGAPGSGDSPSKQLGGSAMWSSTLIRVMSFICIAGAPTHK